MKWLTDRRDLGLADGLLIFFLILYYGKKAIIDNLTLTRTDLTILTLTFLYLIIHQIRFWKKQHAKLKDNLEINR